MVVVDFYFYIFSLFIKGVALLGFNTPPLGALPTGGAGDLLPRISKISRRNLRYRRACPAVVHSNINLSMFFIILEKFSGNFA
jgi:hypothetical protein